MNSVTRFSHAKCPALRHTGQDYFFCVCKTGFAFQENSREVLELSGNMHYYVL